MEGSIAGWKEAEADFPPAIFSCVHRMAAQNRDPFMVPTWTACLSKEGMPGHERREQLVYNTVIISGMSHPKVSGMMETGGMLRIREMMLDWPELF